ncbi:hypothetical protein K474DRAFT_1681082 [Panus rudis PR-1116 ss-1]|nr:hypothetical protein K474DRAFT_1681082 [Panus rudis PR-1116 ss-1]
MRGTNPPRLSTEEWTLKKLLQAGNNLKEVTRISACSAHLPDVILDYEMRGEPLIIEGWQRHERWPEQLFSVDWLLENLGNELITARNVLDRSDTKLSIRELISHCRLRRILHDLVRDSDKLLYGKDAPCPVPWQDWVNTGQVLPSSICPGGDTDLLQHMNGTEAVESLMCYIGIGDTFTPCHKDLCGSSGQNIMTYTEDGGSSFWFMTESSDAPEASKAPFTVYIAEQKLGDLVLVPPRSCHQVVNHGGLTIKTSWSRMTTTGLSVALHHELPLYRRVCRPEQYRIKHLLYRSVIHHTQRLTELPLTSRSREDLNTGSPTLRLKPPTANARRDHATSSTKEHVYLMCDFCGADIFQSFFECRDCAKLDDHETEEDWGSGVLICPGCYVEGRTCECGSMQAVQCRPFSQLLSARNAAAETLRSYSSLLENEALMHRLSER